MSNTNFIPLIIVLIGLVSSSLKHNIFFSYLCYSSWLCSMVKGFVLLIIYKYLRKCLTDRKDIKKERKGKVSLYNRKAWDLELVEKGKEIDRCLQHQGSSYYYLIWMHMSLRGRICYHWNLEIVTKLSWATGDFEIQIWVHVIPVWVLDPHATMLLRGWVLSVKLFSISVKQG